MITNETATGMISGIVNGFAKAAKKKLERGDTEGALRSLDTLIANFVDPQFASIAYVSARETKERTILDIEGCL